MTEKERQRRVALKIRKLRAEGYSQDQAVAIALSMADRGQIGPRGGYQKRPFRRNGASPGPQTAPGPRMVPDRYLRDYTEKHWGESPDYLYEVQDPRLPAVLVEMGKLEEIEVDTFVPEQEQGADRLDRLSPGGGTISIRFPEDDRCILAYHPKTHVLYAVYPSSLHQTMRNNLWTLRGPTWSLGQVARATGGARSRHRYPGVQVQPLGLVRHVIYYTHKQGDGPSRYIHELGEDGGQPPTLAVSDDGQLWWAGGDYTVEEHGIID